MVQPQAQQPQASINPQMQAQAAQQVQQGAPQAPGQMAPTGNNHAPQHDGQSGRANQPYDPKILAHIEQHLTQLPDQQKAFLVQYMTPELAIILGIVIGNEAFDYFKQYADPRKMLVVQPRPDQGQQGQQGAPQQGQPPQQGPQPQAAPPVQPAPVQTNPKSNLPQQNIMGR